jgi:methylated-DNA-[protein]-cysteine S-methyltransferase
VIRPSALIRRASPKRRAPEARREVPRRVLIAKATLPAGPGRIWILATQDGVREIRLSDREAPTRAELHARGWKLVRRPRWTDPARAKLERYLAGRGNAALDFALDLGIGTPFQRRVWEAARKIPYGTVVSYAELAHMAGSEGASRAVGNAMGANPVPIVVPCHRVVHSDRSIGGFSSGLHWKRFLLELERGQIGIDWKPRRRFLFVR